MSTTTGSPVGTRIPRATYRLQLTPKFTFNDAAGLLDYLDALGISDAYVSPIFRAAPQSTHGYDICDFSELNPELGGAEGFDRLARRIRELGLGLLVDMVPNHMGNDLSNAAWVDVLRNGERSTFAEWFDINWRPAHCDFTDKILLPVLEDHYFKVLESGKLRVVWDEETQQAAVAYHERLFPIASGTWLPAPGKAQPVSAQLEALNGRPGEPRSFDCLHALLQRQHYRLAYWRAGSEEINYRRFFEVTELVSLRMELPHVREATHQLLFQLIQEGKITGLRIDHPDGLWAPAEYFRALQERQPLYVVVEKILTGPEPLPSDWPVQGTTGYDFLNRANSIFVDQSNAEAFDRFYREFTRRQTDFAAEAYEGKKWILRNSLISELNALTCLLKEVAVKTRRGQDFTLSQLNEALCELITAFPAYRTYITEQSTKPSEYEAACIRQALRAAEIRNPRLDPNICKLLEGLLLLSPPADLDAEGQTQARDFVLRFQQLTGPVMAKGVEDTAFYNYLRLVSLNEVGGDPSEFGSTLEQFHQFNLNQYNKWPHSLLASATHDTKRGEDARARINVLSEMPQAWANHVERWHKLNLARKAVVDGEQAPDSNDEYLFYQMLIGCGTPSIGGRRDSTGELADADFRQRLEQYMLKAIKESKRHTTWADPNKAYEDATSGFMQRMLAEPDPEFADSFIALQKQVEFFGYWNSLSQTLLKLAAPGVPDVYQGTELWDFSMVDPDNRRAVDYETRRQFLSEVVAGFQTDTLGLVDQLLRTLSTGRIKLFVVWRSLNARKEAPELFERGSYQPIAAIGDKQEHVCSFARTYNDRSLVVVVPRLIFGLLKGVMVPPISPSVWGDTVVRTPPGRRYRDAFTNELLSAGREGLLVGHALQHFPVALLEQV